MSSGDFLSAPESGRKRALEVGEWDAPASMIMMTSFHLGRLLQLLILETRPLIEQNAELIGNQFRADFPHEIRHQENIPDLSELIPVFATPSRGETFGTVLGDCDSKWQFQDFERENRPLGTSLSHYEIIQIIRSLHIEFSLSIAIPIFETIQPHGMSRRAQTQVSWRSNSAAGFTDKVSGFFSPLPHEFL